MVHNRPHRHSSINNQSHVTGYSSAIPFKPALVTFQSPEHHLLPLRVTGTDKVYRRANYKQKKPAHVQHRDFFDWLGDGAEQVLKMGKQFVETEVRDLVDTANVNPLVWGSDWLDRQQDHIQSFGDKVGLGNVARVVNTGLDIGLSMYLGPVVSGAIAASQLADSLIKGEKISGDDLLDLGQSLFNYYNPEGKAISALLDLEQQFGPQFKQAIDLGQQAAGMYSNLSDMAKRGVTHEDIAKMTQGFGQIADTAGLVGVADNIRNAHKIYNEVRQSIDLPIQAAFELEDRMREMGDSDYLYHALQTVKERNMHAVNEVIGQPMQRIGHILEQYRTPPDPFYDRQESRIPDFGAPLRGHLNFGDDHAREPFSSLRDTFVQSLFDTVI